MSRVRLLAATAAVLLVAGCSSGSSSSTPTPEPTPSATTAVSVPGAVRPEPGCPNGAYLLTSFEGRGDAVELGKGSGGNIGVNFTSGTFTISSDGSQPVKLDLGSVNAQVRLDGQIDGTSEGDPSALRMTTKSARGDISVKGFGVSRSYAVSSLADQLIGRGATAQVTCDSATGAAVLVLPNATLTLTRVQR